MGIKNLLLKDVVDAFFKKDGLLSKSFTNYEYRKSQHEMAIDAASMFEDGGIYIVESGTGTGKTFAYLIPSILSGQRVVISTKTKNLQDQLYFKDLLTLNNIFKFNINATFIKGRNNYVCIKKVEKLLERSLFFDNELKIIKEWMDLTESGDLAELNNIFANQKLISLISSNRDTCFGTKCEFFKECFITKLKVKAEKSDIIIVNHHLLFSDAKIKKQGYGKVLPDYKYLICDEAHSLEDIATEHFSESLSKFQLNFFVSELYEILGNNAKNLENAVEELFSEFKGKNRKSLYEFDLDKISKKADFLISSIQQAINYVKDESIIIKGNELIELINKIFFENKTNYIKWVDFGVKNITIYFSPIEVSGMITDFFNNLKGIFLTSATLSINNEFNFLKNRLGINETVSEKIYSSPFNYKEQVALFIPESISDPFSKNFISELSDYLIRILEITEGKGLILFTSLKNMKLIGKVLKEKLNYPIFIQGESSNIDLLENFKKNNNSILLGSYSFWEGIDIEEENLKLVAIDKLPFSPPNDPLKIERINYLRQEGKNPFFEYQLPEAIMFLKQGFGRLIRSKKHRGILALFDNRIKTKNYGKIFLKNLPEVEIFENIEKLKKFYYKIKN